eukprot:13568441-Alexandrium_andersonii.AAC.1
MCCVAPCAQEGLTRQASSSAQGVPVGFPRASGTPELVPDRPRARPVLARLRRDSPRAQNCQH